MHYDGPQLDINLEALAANYRLLRDRFSGQECAGVVKANAYGLGVEDIAQTLHHTGCETFFVATLEEAVQLRSILPRIAIAVLHGVGPHEEKEFLEHHLIPVIGSIPQIERWRDALKDTPGHPSFLHLDTAMARLGLEQSEWETLANNTDLIKQCQIKMMMTHLACASEPDHPSNAMQLDMFMNARKNFPGMPASMVNSGGIFLDDNYHFDVARPGCALYGINPTHMFTPNPVQHVATLSAPILQLRTLEKDQAVGYGATKSLKKDSIIATLALGYADGLFRTFSNNLYGYVGEYQVPLVGRVTMDMICLDVSNVPEGLLNEAGRIELINERQDVNVVAEKVDTIGYEVFSRLGRRVKRVYHGGAS